MIGWLIPGFCGRWNEWGGAEGRAMATGPAGQRPRGDCTPGHYRPPRAFLTRPRFALQTLPFFSAPTDSAFATPHRQELPPETWPIGDFL